MNVSDKRSPGAVRRWPWLLLGYALGLVTAAAISAVPRQRWQYRLVADLPLEEHYFFTKTNASPMKGILRAGTSFDLELRKSIGYYLSFHTVVNGPRFAPLCEPVNGSPPFLTPEHAALVKTAPSSPSETPPLTPPSLPAGSPYAGPNPGVQRTRFARR